MATCSSILAWKNPTDRGTWWGARLEVEKESDTTGLSDSTTTTTNTPGTQEKTAYKLVTTIKGRGR